MFEYFILAYHLAREAIAQRNLRGFIKSQVFRNRLVVPVEMDLLCDLHLMALLLCPSKLCDIRLRPNKMGQFSPLVPHL